MERKKKLEVKKEAPKNEIFRYGQLLSYLQVMMLTAFRVAYLIQDAMQVFQAIVVPVLICSER